jgi:hypothetical protein
MARSAPPFTTARRPFGNDAGVFACCTRYSVCSIGFLIREILRNSRTVSRRPSRVREKQARTNGRSFTELSF